MTSKLNAALPTIVELGASTIVGSAAFNLLVISGLSIYAVSEENDIDENRD